MTVKVQGFGIKSMLDVMLRTLNPVQLLRDQARKVAASKRWHQKYLRPCQEVLEDRIRPVNSMMNGPPSFKSRRALRLNIRPSIEVLESRVLPSINATVSPYISSEAYTSQMSSSSNPGSAIASWSTSSENISTQGSASFSTTASTITMDATTSSNEQFKPPITNDFLDMDAETQISFSGSFTLPFASIVTVSGSYEQSSPQIPPQYPERIGSIISQNKLVSTPIVANADGSISAPYQITGPENFFFFDAEIQSESYINKINQSGPTETTLHLEISVTGTTQLTPTSLAWDNTKGGADFGYQVSNAPVPTNTQESLYWSRTNQFSGIIGGPVYTQAIPEGTAVGSYGPFNVPVSELGTPPQGANYLLAVTDPNNVLGNFSPATNVTALAYQRATQLVVSTATQPPAIVGINQPFQVQALAEDANGNVDQFFNGSVTIQLSNNPSNATLSGPSGSSGTVTVTAVNGKVDFSGLALNLAGTADTLQVSSSGFSSVATSGFTVAYTPTQIRTAYGFDRIPFLTSSTDPNYYNENAGKGQTIAIIGIGDNPNLLNSGTLGFSSSDLALFDQTFSLPDPPSFLKLNSSLQTSNLPSADSQKNQNEAAMDVEWAHAIAPAANIILVEAANLSLTDILTFNYSAIFNSIKAAAGYPGVSVVSLSFGGSADFNPTQYAIIASWINVQNYDSTVFTRPGVTFLASAGDDGGGLTTYPAISPNVVAVGGTSLSLNANNSYQSELGWSGSGGGTSSFEAEPAYQSSVQNTGDRAFPDVAFDAAPTTGVAVNSPGNGTSSWIASGGTSLGAPCWAALIALVNQGRGTNLDGRTQTLPALYSLSLNGTYFHTNLGGDNGTSNLPGLILQSPERYDYITGLGTPIADQLVPALIAWKPVTVSPTSLPADTVGVAYQQTLTASGGGGGYYTFAVTTGTLPTGLTLDNSTGVISGIPTSASTVNFVVTATDPFGATGTQNYTLTINPVNVTSQVSSTASGLVYNRGTQLFGGTITLTNTGTTTLLGTLEVVLTGLPSGATLANASSYTTDGNPYILVSLPNNQLAPGASVTFMVYFANPKRVLFGYTLGIFDENSPG